MTPYFTVPDADGFITFLHALFGAELIKDTRYDNGTIQHARLRIGTSVLMLNQATRDYPANISQIHIQVSDAAAAYAKALELGAISLMSPNLRPHGEHMAGITDPFGNIWWLASRA
ncbi:VOC family protein [Shimia marina]|uniref:Putative enzyme related to lactoylglutathione lyase n=1 Tax=Shimia marina TaxID=321267 RepID=A0A0P1EUQ9_9RHOB|nr:VOC family protein [Shimia marina]CUH54378.1 putative enzyme related to lactoylglutathione lyase [Shimia marina]SFE02114.1 transposase, IS4 family [Shimia marina]